MLKLRVIEIGGTHLRRADLEDDKILNLAIFRTREILKGDILKSLEDFTLDNWPKDTSAIIFLVAGPVDGKTLKNMTNFLEFPENVDFEKMFGKQAKVLVYNDMTAATIGMAKLLEQEKVVEPFWGITWSTGLNAKFWDKKILVDQELGHLPIGEKEAETLLGGKALEQEIGQKLEQVSIAYQLGDDLAINFYNEKARTLGKFLAGLDRISPADLYVFKGSIAKNLLPNENIKTEIIDSFNEELGIERDIKLIISPEPDKDEFIGALYLAKRDLGPR